MYNTIYKIAIYVQTTIFICHRVTVKLSFEVYMVEMYVANFWEIPIISFHLNPMCHNPMKEIKTCKMFKCYNLEKSL